MMQPDPNLAPANINELGNELSVFSNQYDLRHDLHVYVEYIQDRDVKRLHRSNELNRADSKRLAKLMSDPYAIKEVEQKGYSKWINYVDMLAYVFEFVKYDTEGIYVGYTSSEPSFPDNYIDINAEEYEEFIDLPLLEQEQKLLDPLVNHYRDDKNEFYNTSALGRLLGFSTRGCATGIIPDLDFARGRRFLLEVLQSCKPGVWYTTSSLIQYLKKHHPYFLIPEKPKYRYKQDVKNGRYGNFREGERWDKEIKILESDADAFERVEGRYVERFLEGLPLILGYIEVAYSKTEYKGDLPEIDQLQAFRVNDKFLHVMGGKIIEPKVTVQPNFEVHVESELYPVRIITQLTKLADVVTKDKASILKLRKKKVLTQLSIRGDLDVIRLLEKLSYQKLPQNVRIELEEWVGASEAFTLYEKAVLFEGDKDLPEIDQFTIQRISPTMRIVHSPDRLFTHLEQNELIPLHIKHRSSALTLLPDGVRTVFPKRDSSVSKVKAGAKIKKPVTIKREVQITFHFPAKELMEEFRKGLIAARCPVAADWSKLTLSFASQYEPEVKKVSKALKQDYFIKIEDIA
ncbi:MAG: hypothetical protein HF976_04790 [ANME-2 cluster archaeon]|nr:hypothetical protein [ANME-2 cluster archaeon]MBC2708933.1 hypothetical protein [ANME-2 cluster archaeon]MBC2748142.1 hypothetical protein [ANME-2 cluster archaeon]MBC2762748.1 hypothetical protein [ANME-2 cluster archaeon]